MRLTEEQKQETLRRLEEMIAANNNANGEGGAAYVSRVTGVSTSVISQLRNGTYKAKTDGKLQELHTYFATKDAAAKTCRMARTYAPTSISEDIRQYMRYCQLKGGVISLTGDAGIGKTMAIRKYMADYPGNVVRITMRNGYTALKVILIMLAEALGAGTSGGIYTLCGRISERLRDGMLLIVDEAQHCSLKQIDLLRSFSDEKEEQGQTLGICFVGNRKTADKFGGAADSELGQISSRALINRHYSVHDVKREDIALLFPGVAEQAACVDFLHGLAQDTQGIRGAANAYATAMDNGDVTYDGLCAAAKHRAAYRKA